MILNADKAEQEKLRNLKPGDFVYSAGYEFDGEDGKILITKFEFVNYIKNETDIEKPEGIQAILIDPKFPKVKIPQDLATSWYINPRTAVESFREAISGVLQACAEWLLTEGSVY